MTQRKALKIKKWTTEDRKEDVFCHHCMLATSSTDNEQSQPCNMVNVIPRTIGDFRGWAQGLLLVRRDHIFWLTCRDMPLSDGATEDFLLSGSQGVTMAMSITGLAVSVILIGPACLPTRPFYLQWLTDGWEGDNSENSVEKVKFTLEQSTKAQRGSTSIALLFL